MSLEIDILPLGPLMTNCYVLSEDGACWIIDPSLWPRELLALLQERKLQPQRVLLTHGHGDHIGGVDVLRKAYPDLRVTCPAGDAAMLADAELNMSADFNFPITISAADDLVHGGDTLSFGPHTVQVLDTSGHTPGGVSYYCPDAQAAFTGDALFASSVGRCDLPGGNMQQLLTNIQKNLLSLPPATRVLPGHGGETTIGTEARQNPYL